MPGSFNRLPEIIAALQPAVDAAVLAAVEPVVETAKALVPKETRRLAEAIHIEEAVEGVYVVAGDRDVFYGHMVEHGTSHSAPRPFLVPALEAHSESIVQAARSAVGRVT